MFQTVNTLSNNIRKNNTSYNDYLLKTYSSEEDLDNEWGWFIDIDIDTNENLKKKEKKKHISIPHTIYEVSSKNDMQDLYDSVEDYYKKIRKSELNTLWMVHATCIISLVCVFIII
jgi:hypothetical protein